MSLRLGVVTVGRSDYGIYYSLLRLLENQDGVDLQLIVAGAHLDAKYGNTVEEIEKDGFQIASRVPMPMRGDSRESVADAIGIGVREFTSVYCKIKPDLLLLLGDRYEMWAAGIAALPMLIPVAHIHGGELTFGSIDDAIRHSITKLSHIHFVATAEYARRVRQLGEEPWRVHITGSPVIDSILSAKPTPRSVLEAELGLDLSRTLLVTYHPVTLEDNSEGHVKNLLAALSKSGHSLLFTFPNADFGSSEIVRSVKEFVDRNEDAKLVSNLGHHKYHSVQRFVAAMVGNSSSGIIEAASFHLPVVNIGIRQAGRTRPRNVIDVGNSEAEITEGIVKAVSPEFRSSVADLQNPYGDGRAAVRIATVLREVKTEPLLQKKFMDYPIE